MKTYKIERKFNNGKIIIDKVKAFEINDCVQIARQHLVDDIEAKSVEVSNGVNKVIIERQ